MKNFKFWVIALVAILGLNSCSEDCDHEFIEHDYSQDLVGIWTCVEAENEFAEALVIKADGSVEVKGSVNGEYWESKGTIKVVNNKMIYNLENGDEWEGRFELVAGESFSMVLDDELDIRYTYQYCKNDLADEIVGMWVCKDGGLPGVDNDMLIMTFSENGKMTMTTPASAFIPFDYVNEEVDYVIVGDLLFKKFYGDNPAEGYIRCQPSRLIYLPNETTLGDMLMENIHAPYQNGSLELNVSFHRVKQHLELAGQKYDYNNTYVSNVKGLDEDMTMMGYTFNIGKMEGKNLDKMLKTLLFAVEFPNANTIKYQYHYNGQNLVFEAPIVVDGNKVTIKMSEFSPYYRDVDMYMYQDKDNTQLHMYMPTYAFINYFANMDLAALAVTGDIDLTDEAAVEAIFERMDERVESINVSFTFKATK